MCQIDSITSGSVLNINNVPYALYDSVTVIGIAHSLVALDECSEIKDTLISLIDIQQQRIDNKDSIIGSIKKESIIRDDILENYKFKDINNKNYISTLKIEAKRTKTKTTILSTLAGILITGLVVGIVIK